MNTQRARHEQLRTQPRETRQASQRLDCLRRGHALAASTETAPSV
jgi:hypothetical protein